MESASQPMSLHRSQPNVLRKVGQLADLKDPFEVTRTWFAEAAQFEPWPYAVSLATVDRAGRPSCRTIILRDVSGSKFYIGASTDSRKARDLIATKYASLVVFWPTTHKQLRVEGHAELELEGLADKYFSQCPEAEQILIRASGDGGQQSHAELISEFDSNVRQFSGEAIPRPAKWRVFGLTPMAFEFWWSDPDWKHECVRCVLDEKTNQWQCFPVGP